MPAARYVLPADLDRCGLLTRLSASQFADALTEAIHAGMPGGARADRAIDVVKRGDEISEALLTSGAPFPDEFREMMTEMAWNLVTP